MYSIELFHPGDGSVKPSAILTADTTPELLALVMLWSGNGYAVRVIEKARLIAPNHWIVPKKELVTS